MAIDRIQEQIRLLRDESLENSLDRLDVMTAYLWPGFPHSGMIPTSHRGHVEANRRVIEEILSNRRFRKCWQELSRHPDAVVLVQNKLRQTLASYSPVYQQFLDLQLQRHLKVGDDVVVVIGVLSNETGDGSLVGLRYKLLALCLLASSITSDELTPDLLAVAKVALAQRRYLDNAELPHGFPLITHASLYNILILGTALYGISLPDRPSEAIERLSKKWIERKLVDYSAPATEYDRDLIFTGKELLPDEEYITVGYFEVLTDQEFERLVQVVSDVRR